MSKREWNVEIDFIGLAIVIFVIGGAISVGIHSYQEGEVNKVETQLKIEQEKTKQLEIKYGKDTANIQR